jgi:hypothetical protein
MTGDSESLHHTGAYLRGAQKSSSHIKILGAKNQVRYIPKTQAQNLDTMITWHPEFVHF